MGVVRGDYIVCDPEYMCPNVVRTQPTVVNLGEASVRTPKAGQCGVGVSRTAAVLGTDSVYISKDVVSEDYCVYGVRDLEDASVSVPGNMYIG